MAQHVIALQQGLDIIVQCNIYRPHRPVVGVADKGTETGGR